MSQTSNLRDKRVLLVEDEYYVADDLRKALVASGASISGPYSTVAAARAAVALERFDCAVIDLNLHDESAIPVAEQLLTEGRPFAIATGYGADALPERLASVPLIEKPYDAETIVRVVAELSSEKAG